MNNYYQSLFRNIVIDFKRNKIRTFLTSLGITIGVFAVVMLIALGLGLKNFISGQFQNLGANIIAIFPAQGPGNFSSLAGSIRFDSRDLRSLQRIDDVDYAIPAFISSTTIKTRSESERVTLIGTDENYLDVFSLDIIKGKKLTRGDISTNAKVGVIGQAIAEKLYPDPEDAVGQTVRIGDLRIKVVGLVANVGIPERDNGLFIPYTTTFNSINTDKEFFAIYLGMEDEDVVLSVKEQAEEVLLERYDDDQFSALEPSEVLETLDQIFGVLNGVLVALGSISLLVGGIGIMNIMYANVTERTKEIGIKRAIGARKKDIITQFVVESTVLSVLGGLLGLGLSVIAVLVIRNFFPVEISVFAVTLAIGASSFIGIFFGSFPARRAANLTPIQAIRS